MKHKIPPPIVALTILICMWVFDLFLHWLQFSLSYSWVIAIVIAGTGMSFIAIGVRSFSKKETTVNPLKPDTASSLVNEGIYRFTRNPMYVGLLIIVIAWGVFLSNGLILLLGPIFFVFYINQFQIKPEEEALETLFGEDYLAYKTKVRRWI